jgi:FlaA1/EpsC-like NDP-sugar epimerase
MIIWNLLFLFTPNYRDLSRSNKRIILLSLDLGLCTLSLFGGLLIFYGIDKTLYLWTSFFPLITSYIITKVLIFLLLGLYRPVVKYTDLSFLSTITKSILIIFVIGEILVNLFTKNLISPSIILIDSLISIVGITALRLTLRSIIKSLIIKDSDLKEKQSLVIYGAGSAGYQLAQSLQENPEYRLLAFVDDNLEMQGRVLRDISIYSPKYLESFYQENHFDTLIFAIPNLSNSRRKEIMADLKTLPVKFKTIPTFQELLSNKTSVTQIRNIEMSELLGREEITPYEDLLKTNITDKAVLVTGAGGSIGSELCRQILQLKPKCLILFELNEFALYSIEMELREKLLEVPIYSYLGNITDKEHFESILHTHQIETIYHAAAYKHVPLVEANVPIGVYNNVAGTLITAKSAINCGVKYFVLISTDKAVRPTNVMGASKRVAELLIQGLASQQDTLTTFAIVRFGNVLNSSGSVIPRFRQQINEGKPITLTHKDITRYFISIPEAVSLVIQAGAMAKGGEIFLLDMGEPVRIYDLAVRMIELNGLRPEKDIPIHITGLRPGEKLYEELLIDKNNSHQTQHPQIFYGNEPMMEMKELESYLEKLLSECKQKNTQAVKTTLKFLVPEYRPNQT